MAKFVKNENESPEVDLKNLTVRLSGMGMDKEIEDVIPGKKSKNYEVNEDDEADENESDDEIEESSDDLIEEESDSDEEFDETQSEEVETFFEKRAAERNLTLENVEKLANEMDSPEKTKAQKPAKQKAEKTESGEKKKAKFDAVTLAGILFAILALGAGIFYIVNSLQDKGSSLGITEKDYREKYMKSPYYTASLASYGFALNSPTYRDSASTNVSEGQYYDAKIENKLFENLYVTGIEVKGGKLLKMLRFYAIVDSEAQVNGMLQILGSYLMPLDSKLESSKAFEKIGNAYLMSLSSTERAVIVKEDNYAFSVSLNTINGYDMVVLDIIPLSEADTYVFQDVI
ncbi:MAG: hypothetical protein J5752_08075 [Clostridiales bacterium]|nr:hypothetical protein [Clostridiales bacterium]